MKLDKSKLNLTDCYQCGKKLKNVSYQRTTPKRCSKCRFEGRGDNAELRKIYRQFLKKPTKPAEDEMVFEDDPRALKEIEYGKVRRVSREHHAKETTLSELI